MSATVVVPNKASVNEAFALMVNAYNCVGHDYDAMKSTYSLQLAKEKLKREPEITQALVEKIQAEDEDLMDLIQENYEDFFKWIILEHYELFSYDELAAIRITEESVKTMSAVTLVRLQIIQDIVLQIVRANPQKIVTGVIQGIASPIKGVRNLTVAGYSVNKKIQRKFACCCQKKIWECMIILFRLLKLVKVTT